MLSLRFKLLIPSLLTTLLMIAGITYITIVENTLFQQDVELEIKLSKLKLYNSFKELTTKLTELSDFIKKDWRIQDSLLTENKDRLLDLITPFHQGFEFDLINIYDKRGILIARADEPSLFGKSDELQQRVIAAIKKPPTKPQITLFENQLVLLDWKILQQKEHGIDAAIMVGYYLNASHLKRIVTYVGSPFLLKYGDELVVNIEDSQITKIAENQEITELVVHLDSLVETEIPFMIILLEQQLTKREKEFWNQLLRLILILGSISIIVILISHYLTTSAARQLQQARHVAEEAARSLKQAKVIAESANHAKSVFLANMSHELRTPLNGILGYAQILNRDQELNTKQKEGIEIIQRSGQYLLTLINDVLDLSKIEAGRTELEIAPISLKHFMQSIVDMFTVRARQKEISFVYQPLLPLPEGLLADEKRLRQIIINLLGNAVKFTEQGTVTLKVQYFHGRLRIEVSDTGIGIAPTDLEKIFLPFEQVSDTTHRAEGTGLGLTITQSLIEMMGGTLQVQSVLGTGSTFWTELALMTTLSSVEIEKEQQLQVIGYQKTSSFNKQDQPYKILIVDDKTESRSFLADFLQPLGFDVQIAEDGQQAIIQVKIGLPDLVLMDLIMPILDGFETTRELRQKFPKLPIIAVSASAFSHDYEEAFAAGFNDFIPKPVEIHLLLEFLQKYLELEWVYKHIESETYSTSSSEELKVELPVHHRTRLLHLARQGDIGGILEYIDHLMQEEPHLLPLLQHIKQLARNFEEETICDLLEQHHPVETENADHHSI